MNQAAANNMYGFGDTLGHVQWTGVSALNTYGPLGGVKNPVDEYNTAERAAIARLPNRIIEASQTVVFDQLGYPSRVSDIKQLWKFSDAMQEQRARVNYEILGGLTDREIALVRDITHTVRNLTEEVCDHRITPASSLLRAVIAFRAIEALDPRPESVLELGPGSGYLGAMLIASGYQYHAVEVCQGFFLWQSLLWGGRANQIPWWDWMTKASPDADLFVANHTVNEMHPMALRYALKRAPNLFMIENYGGEVIRTNAQTAAIFREYGFKDTVARKVAIMHRGEPPKFGPVPLRTKTWADLLELWGGEVPRTEDEKFWGGLT